MSRERHAVRFLRNKQSKLTLLDFLINPFNFHASVYPFPDRIVAFRDAPAAFGQQRLHQKNADFGHSSHSTT
jgi:hypothetical protein